MTTEQLIRFVKDNSGKYTAEQIATCTGETPEIVKKTIRYHKLERYVKGRFDGIVQDLTTNEPQTFSVYELSIKHDMKYGSVDAYLRNAGLIWLCRKKRNPNMADKLKIAKMLTTMTVLQASIEAKRLGYTPHSRQGIMDLCEEFKITPLRLKDIKK